MFEAAAEVGSNAVINGAVYIGNAAVGRTSNSFTYTWNRIWLRHIDPRTHQQSWTLTPLPAMTVRADGYAPIAVAYNVNVPSHADF